MSDPLWVRGGKNSSLTEDAIVPAVRYRAVDLIHEIPLFQGLRQEDRDSLASLAEVVSLEKGKILFHEGEASEYLFNIAQGRIKIAKAAADGREVILEVLAGGDPIGAVAVYQEIPYPATATALEPTLCVRIPRAALFRLLETRPSLVRGLLSALNFRLVKFANQLRDRTGKVEHRFARIFLKLAEETGESTPEGTFIPIVLSRRELADWTGTTLETAIRTMSRWSKEDLVRTEKGGFRILDLNRLRLLAQG
jgi:CRP/FNR family transcriptional regulator